MKLLATLIATLALGAGSSAVDDSATRARVAGVTPYGGYQPYVLGILLPSGQAPSATVVRSDGKSGEIGFYGFSIAPGKYRVIYKCGSNREPTFQGEVMITFRAGLYYVFSCTSDPARLSVEEWMGAVPNNSFKPKPLRGAA